MRDLETIKDVPSGEQIRLHLEAALPYTGYLHKTKGGLYFRGPTKKKGEIRTIILDLEKGRLDGYRIIAYDIISKRSYDEDRHIQRTEHDKIVYSVPKPRKNR